MNPISGITPQPLDSAFAVSSQAADSVTFRNAAAVTDAELAALLRSEDKLSFGKSLPQIPPPASGVSLPDIDAIPPSMGATVMTLIAKLAGESRRASADQRAAEVDNIIAQIKNQSSEMKYKAEQQFAYSLSAAIVTGVTGLAVLGGSAFAAPKMMPGMSPAELSAKQSSFSTIIGAISSVGSGISGSVQAVGTREVGLTDAKIKLKEAEQERIRAMIEQLRSTEESLMDLLRKAIATMDAIQQNTNQTRAKILG